MKLSDNLFEELVAARKKMRADLVSGYTVAELPPLERELAGNGVPIKLDDLERGPGTVLTYKGHVVFVYIQDTGASKYTLENEPESSKKVHLRQCRTLDSMHEQGRYDRYVATQNKDGSFLVHTREKDGEAGEMYANLVPCQNCLNLIRYSGSAKDFSYAKFLSDGKTTTFARTPKISDTDGRQSGYTSDWQNASHNYRESVHYTCEECCVDLSSNKKLLHTHHINGVKSDNNNSNLKALCKLCHNDQPKHNINVAIHERSLIEKLRSSQRAA